MKILIAIQCTNLGGMEQSAYLLARELVAMGVEVEFLSLHELGALAPLLEKAGIAAASTGYRGYAGWRSFPATRRAFRSSRADAMIMVGHNLMAMLAAGKIWRGRQILSMNFHHEGVKHAWAWRLIYRVAVGRFRSIVFPSKFIRDEACRIAPFIARSSRIVSYPFPMPRARIESDVRAARGRLGLRPSDKIVGNAGWLIARKRWDVFLDVAAEVARRQPDARFLIAGDGPDRAALVQQAQRLGLGNRIRWLGWQDDLQDFYRSLDVMLFTSDFDAMGRTPLEAMSHGVPVVASVVHCGLPEVIDSDEVGFLIRDHDISALAVKVAELLGNGDAARRLGEGGRRRVAEIGCPHRHAQGILSALGMQNFSAPQAVVSA